MSAPEYLPAGLIEYAALRIIRRKRRTYTVEKTCCDEDGPYQIEHSALRKYLAWARTKHARTGEATTCRKCTRARQEAAAVAKHWKGPQRDRETVWTPTPAELPPGILPAATAWAPTPTGRNVPVGWIPR